MNKHAFIVYELIVIIFLADTEWKSFASSDISIKEASSNMNKRHDVARLCFLMHFLMYSNV